MPCEILVDGGPGIVELRLLGQIPPGEHVKARKELIEICRACNLNKILVDARELLFDPRDIVELFNFGDSWVRLAQQTPIFLAGVFPRDAATHIWLDLGENVAFVHSTRAFDNIDDARAWLREIPVMDGDQNEQHMKPG